jgi:hypothetical protein
VGRAVARWEGESAALALATKRRLFATPISHTKVAIGEAVAGRISAWLASGAAPPVACRVLTVGDDLDTGDALRAAAPRLDPNAAGVVVYSGDLVCDAPLGAIALSHALSGALATVLVSKRRGGPPSADTKPGKAPKVSGFFRGARALCCACAVRTLLVVLIAACSPQKNTFPSHNNKTSNITKGR